MGENVIDSFRGKYGFLSNFHESSVTLGGITYRSGEAAYQAQKCSDKADKVQFQSLDAGDAKRLGRRVNLRKDWDQVKEQVMYEVELSKYTQNPELRGRLLETGDAQLIEGNNWRDTYWGVCRGIGQNKLGKILMAVREELKNEEE